MHDSFQMYLDHLLASKEPLENKLKALDTHLKTHFKDYQEMTLAEASTTLLENDQYYYITFTYLDAPINLLKDGEVVVSMIYDTIYFYIEVSVFYSQHQEYTYQITQTQIN